MKAARIAVLVVAIGAGGIAALLWPAVPIDRRRPCRRQWRRSKPSMSWSPKSDLGIGQALGPQDIAWQPWPTASASPNFINAIRSPRRRHQTGRRDCAHTFCRGRADPRKSSLIKGKGSGYMAAILPSGMRAISTEISPETGAGGFILPNDRVDVILSRRDREAEKISRRRDAHVARRS